MDKLIELLLEYDSGLYAMLRIKQNINGTNILEIFDSLNFLQNFVKWLVKKNKIDLGKLIMIKDEEQKAIVDIDNSRENTLLMLTSIQDEPIEFLISILK